MYRAAFDMEEEGERGETREISVSVRRNAMEKALKLSCPAGHLLRGCEGPCGRVGE
jgi:hypothetical protein